MTVRTQQWQVTSVIKPNNSNNLSQTIGHSQAQQPIVMVDWPTKVTQIHMELVKVPQGSELARKAELTEVQILGLDRQLVTISRAEI